MITGLGKHASTVLIFLLERGKIKKTDLKEVISNPQTYDRMVKELKNVGFVEVREKVIGRRVLFVSLTPKGRAVAEQLKHAEDAAKGRKFTFPDKFAIISFLDKKGSTSLHDLKDEFQDATELVRDLERLKIIKQEIDHSSHPPVNFIVLTEKGKEIALLLRKIEEILKG